MIVECTRRFLDVETGDIREVGDRFEASPKRFAAINGSKYGQLAIVVEEAASEEREKPASKPRRGRPRKAEPKREG